MTSAFNGQRACMGIITCAAILTSSFAIAQHRPAYRYLLIDGFKLQWKRNKNITPLRLTWAYAAQNIRFPDARNCRGMTALSAISSQLGMDIVHQQAVAAFAAWEGAAALRFEFTTDWKDANILIGAQTNPRGVAYANVEFEKMVKTKTGRITRGLVCLNPEKTWKVGFNGDLKSYDLRYVLMHEIGHTLGLNHAGASGQVMSFRYDELLQALTRHDIAGVTSLYGFHRTVRNLKKR